MTREVLIRNLHLGGGHPVLVQSMTNTDTANQEATLDQIKALSKAGCDLVRVSVYNEDCARAVRFLRDHSPVPVVADIHFDYRLALLSLENGIDKLRINPGNLAGEHEVKLVADSAKQHKVPIRIGVNSGSIPKDILARDGGVTAKGLVDSAARHVRLLEKEGFEDIVLSMKASEVRLTVDAYQLAASTFDYPLHVGVTEAGLPGQGTIKSAIGIGALLLLGIGDTIRVSLTGSPLPEAQAAIDILRAVGLRDAVELISCPTCGRTSTDIERIARQVEEGVKHITKPLKVAVMGCVVNGPGEAQGADLALCGGGSGHALYVKGKFVKKITGDPVPEFLTYIEQAAKESL